MTDMSQKIRRRKMLVKLNRLLTPRSLNKQHRLAVFQRLNSLLNSIPADYWGSFGQFLPKVEGLARRQAQCQISDNSGLVFESLRKTGQLTSTHYAAAICSPIDHIEPVEREKYEQWLALTLLCCLQLETIGSHASAIQCALREIRLIATDVRHRPLLQSLPDPMHASSLWELNLALRTTREDEISTHRGEEELRGLSYLHVVINDAYNNRTGIQRTRTIRVTIEREQQLSLKSDPVLDDEDIEVAELRVTPSPTAGGPDETDEPLLVRPGQVLRVQVPGPHKSTAMQALQGQRLAEQLSIRNQSLPCSYDQATDWDIQHLIAELLAQLQEDAESAVTAGWLLLSLCSGRDANWLWQAHQKSKFLQLLKGHPCLVITHRVPAGIQREHADQLLPEISDKLYLALPSQLTAWFGAGIQSPTSSDATSLLKAINERHLTRLTLGRISRYLKHSYINEGRDRAEIALIRGMTHQERPALSYSNFDVNPLVEHYYAYLNAIFSLANSSPQLPPRRPIARRLGSRLNLPKNVLQNWFALLARPLSARRDASLQAAVTFHNAYVIYTWALLSFATGHRDVTAPLGQLSDYNSKQKSWWISDKEVRHGLAARTILLPETAAQQVTHYLDHLQALATRTNFVVPQLSQRCQSALQSSGNLLFAIVEAGDQGFVTQDLTPKLLNTLLQKRQPWSRNWPRHHLCSELKRRGFSGEIIDGWMGHEEIGEEALGRHSCLSMQHLQQIADAIEDILTTHKIEAVSGWQTL
ncbi:TPA: hypothetical protein QHC28_002280 [Aeromonas veronii bv. veronii]|nr:hypothetical protein [Aeromonas veronii bv. veronii]